MEPDFWQRAWQEDRTGFHQSRINSRLERFWPTLSIATGAEVFVPLCGKSQDMFWLHQQGHRVLGVELSEKAAQAFFDTNSLPYNSQPLGDFQQYEGVDSAAGIRLLVGDFFSLNAEHLAHSQAFYDRASMIAMPDDMRRDYARHLASVIPSDCVGLLLAINYDPSQMRGPPFAVSDENVRQLLGDAFAIDELEYFSGPERLGNLADRGLDTLEERTYRLRRIANNWN